MPLDEVVLKAAEAAVVAAPLLRGKRARPSLSDQRQPSTRASSVNLCGRVCEYVCLPESHGMVRQVYASHWAKLLSFKLLKYYTRYRSVHFSLYSTLRLVGSLQ